MANLKISLKKHYQNKIITGKRVYILKIKGEIKMSKTKRAIQIMKEKKPDLCRLLYPGQTLRRFNLILVETQRLTEEEFNLLREVLK